MFANVTYGTYIVSNTGDSIVVFTIFYTLHLSEGSQKCGPTIENLLLISIVG